MREEEIKQLEIYKIHWRDLYWEECEKNKKLEEKNKRLEKENFVMRDRLKFWYKWVTREEIEEVEKEIQETQKTLDHRDTVLSIMYDLVRNNSVPDDRKIRIIKKITSVEAWDDFYEKDEDVINFYKRIFKPYL